MVNETASNMMILNYGSWPGSLNFTHIAMHSDLCCLSYHLGYHNEIQAFKDTKRLEYRAMVGNQHSLRR